MVEGCATHAQVLESWLMPLPSINQPPLFPHVDKWLAFSSATFSPRSSCTAATSSLSTAGLGQTAGTRHEAAGVSCLTATCTPCFSLAASPQSSEIETQAARKC